MANNDWDAMQKARDDDLRPWVRDPVMDLQIDAQFIELQEGFKRTAPMDKSGAVSQLDRKPQQLIALHETFRAKHISVAPTASAVAVKEGESAPDDTTTNSEAKALAQKTHAVLAALESRRSSRASTKRGKRANAAAATASPKNRLEAVRYDPVGPRRGPATYNMSAAEYQRFAAKMAAMGNENVDTFAMEGADETKYDLESLDDGGGGSVDGISDDFHDDDGDVDSVIADGGGAVTKLPPINESPHRPTTTTDAAALLFKDTPLKPPTAAATTPPPGSAGKPKLSANSWLKVEGTHVASPSLAIATAPATAPASPGPLVIEATAKTLAAHAITIVTHPPTPPRLQISRDGALSLFAATVPEAESKLLNELTSPPSAKSRSLALAGHSLTGSEHLYGPHGNALGHKRIKELKALKELMMTTTGSVGINVHPETSADVNEENKRMRQVTIQCIQDCMERNQTDSTGSLLVTPGYLEALGPSNFYKSDAQQGFVLNDRFQEALKNVDVSRGLKMDGQGKWVENAAKNRQKMFVSGGAMKL